MAEEQKPTSDSSSEDTQSASAPVSPSSSDNTEQHSQSVNQGQLSQPQQSLSQGQPTDQGYQVPVNPSSPQSSQPHFQPNMLDLQALKSAQRFTMVGSVAGPISLFIGGILLGAIGLVCAIIGNRKYVALEAKQTEVSQYARRMKKASKVAIIVCIIAIVLNAVSLVIMWPQIMQMVQSGDVAGIAQNAGSAAGTTSTWG